ncbi:kinesin-like protein KIF25 [Tubulanus polymorphus]|uniref:kinesin-like protein KIF25 n=1 Tax=Tubulanus polymorphus TaxID=672921 RepID=UPI003DA424DE
MHLRRTMSVSERRGVISRKSIVSSDGENNTISNYVLDEKIKIYEGNIRRKDERIFSLETENAMLYLKLAQLEGSLQSARLARDNALQMFLGEQYQSRQITINLSRLKTEIQILREELTLVRKSACTLPQQFEEQCQMALSHLNQGNIAPLFSLKQDTAYKTEISELTEKLSETEKSVKTIQASYTELDEKYTKEKKRRKELHNLLMELRGNIRVHCRLRPLLDFDSAGQDHDTVGMQGTPSEEIVNPIDEELLVVNTSKQTKVFEFDRVLGMSTTQMDVFKDVQPLITSLLDGYNVCIMAYGQTGSGKTHSMIGSHRNDSDFDLSVTNDDEGLVPRANRELFRLLEEWPEGSHTVEISVVEIYNNEIRDLLGSDATVKHDVVKDPDGGMHTPTVVSKVAENVETIMTYIHQGLKNRQETTTAVHEHSSRSHLVVTISIYKTCCCPPESPITKIRSNSDTLSVPSSPRGSFRARKNSLQASGSTSSLSSRSSSPSTSLPQTRVKLQLVDLAGSECVGMSGVKGAALREASNINKSLSALADVLGALSDKRSHVPYRNCKLTHLLADSIGGDAKLMLMLCVSPVLRFVTETMQCLQFGTRARQVERGPVLKRRSSERNLKETKDNNSKEVSRPKSAIPFLRH